MSDVMQTDLIQIGGAGPAGLAAAITLARAGRRVLVHEMQSEVGHCFEGDFQGLENWSTQQDVLDLLREIGITTEFAMLPCDHGYAFDAWGERYEMVGRKTFFTWWNGGRVRMRDILSRLHYAGKKNKLVQPDPDIAFEFTPGYIAAKRLAR